MLQAILIVIKCLSCIEWGVDINALYFPRVFLLQCLEPKEIISSDEHVLKQVVF